MSPDMGHDIVFKQSDICTFIQATSLFSPKSVEYQTLMALRNLARLGPFLIATPNDGKRLVSCDPLTSKAWDSQLS